MFDDVNKRLVKDYNLKSDKYASYRIGVEKLHGIPCLSGIHSNDGDLDIEYIEGKGLYIPMMQGMHLVYIKIPTNILMKIGMEFVKTFQDQTSKDVKDTSEQGCD